MDRLMALQAFARVVELGGFTKASDSLQMSTTSVSDLVQSLEKHLGVRLLQRTTRRVTVTPDGAAFYERSAHILADLDEAEASDAAIPCVISKIPKLGRVGHRRDSVGRWRESYPDVFQPFGGFADDIAVEDGRVRLPDIVGIGFEAKSDLYALMQTLVSDVTPGRPVM